MLRKTYKTFVLTMLFLISLFFNGPPAYAWSDSGLGCAKGTQVTVSGWSPSQLYYLGVWKVQISGAKSGSGQDVFLNAKSDGSGNGYNFVDANNVSQIAQDLNGEPTFVSSQVNSFKKTISWGSGSQQRIYLRDFATLCGAEVTGFDFGTVYVLTTAKPDGQINPPVTLKAGQSAKISISGSSFVPNTSPYKSISWAFKVNGSQVDSGSGTLSFSKQVSYTFSSAGTYTLTLEITDGVGRKSTITKTVTVSGQPTPPPPNPGGNIPPVADFDMPLSSEVGQSVQITDRSYDPDGTIASRSWTVTPSTYSGSLSGTGGTLTFNAKGTYTVTLRVTDNKGATGTASKTIFVGEAPPPPPPPAPQNDPPVARFTMPSRTGPGKTVNVTNTSYDPDGYIESVSWQVTPSVGVTKNLGDNGGTIVFSQTGTYTVKLTVVDDFGDSSSYEKEIEVINQPPEVRISMPDKAIQGDEVTIRSTSRDPDGTIVEYTWAVTPAGMVGTLSGESSTVYFDVPGTYTVTLKVKDDYGAESTTSAQIEVTPAIPQAFFTDTGVYKQNRKITVTEQGVSSARYPIDKSSDEWRVLPVSGGASGDTIMSRQVSPDKLELLFKTPGTYKIGLRVKNTAGYWSEWYEREFNISPDLPPVANFNIQSAFIRDPADTSVNGRPTATVDVRDMSYSPDGDIIAHRTWKYRYDSDNDGSFEDETWVVFSNGNELAPSFKTNQVGKYQIELEVTEGFGEETIPEFINIDDIRMSDTSSKPLEEKVTQVANLRPAVSFQVKKKHVVDVVIAEGPKQQVWEFNYTGSPQSVTLQPGTYLFEAWGAQGGGTDPNNLSIGSRAGKGGYTKGKLTLTTSTTFYVYVGGQGTLSTTGGWNGGGGSTSVCSGGGATDFRLAGGAWDDVTGLRSRIMVAGGGGGSDNISSEAAGSADDGSGGNGGGLRGGYGLRDGVATYGGGSQNGTVNSTGILGSFGKGGSGTAYSVWGTPQPPSWYETMFDPAGCLEIKDPNPPRNTAPVPTGIYFLAGTSSYSISFSSPCNVVYAQFASCDWNDGTAQIYVDGQLVTEHLTRRANSTWILCKVYVTYGTHTVMVKAKGDGDLHFDFFASAVEMLPADAGGGGGGYYGGNGSNYNNGGGGGGSSFISGHPGCNAVNASGVHTGQPNHYSGLVFTETVMQSGVQAGNGYARITRLDSNNSALDTARQALESQLQAAGLDAKVTYCDTTVLDSRSANAEMIFSQWVNFPNNKTLDEVVKTLTWRENSQKFILDVNSNDYSTTYLNDPSKCGELFTRTLSNNIDLSILGTSSNQASALQMIALNDGNGAFFLQTATNMEPIADYGQYIINKILGKDTLSNYFLLNEEVYYETYYNDPENDPECKERWMKERWMYEHDPAYFENSLGRADFDQQWLPAPVKCFDKVGKFTTTFQKRDNPKY